MAAQGYQDINTIGHDLEWLSLYFIAHTPREVTDDEKLNLLSEAYYYEQNKFKKQDLAAELLPDINARIAKFKGDYQVKIPIIAESDRDQFRQKQKALHQTMLVASSPTLGPYDLKNEQFPIRECGFNIYSIRFSETSRTQRVPLVSDFKALPEYCHLRVADEQQARAIEEVVTSNIIANNIDSRGVIFYKLSANSHQVIATPVFADVTFINKATNKELASKAFHFQ